MEIEYFDINKINNDQFDFAIVCAVYKGKWVFVKQRNRDTWDMPGGHKEENEDVNVTASRELYEETGTLDHEIEPLYDYSVTIGETTTYGRLFYAKVIKIGFLPESEISEVRFFKIVPDNLTYPEIQRRLLQEVLQYLSKKSVDILKNDKVKNINIINFIRNNQICTFDMLGESVLVRGRSDEDWIYISSKSFDEFIQLLEGLDVEDKCFAAIEEWMLPYIINGKEIMSQLTSIKLVYDKKALLPFVKANVVRLSISDAQYVFDNSMYKEYISVEYIEERINRGIGLGIWEDGKLIAWAITHDDGAIGFLNVLEEYREKGYGSQITVAMIRQLLELDELPFVHIEEENKRSMNLALKVGFKKDRRVHWIKLK
ncbi:GNAT family N-acetyltransferase [Acetivibrio cellulolyticus]|uniref:GNAT family N-acetyltransferase n=1 Tax=Acetivibrio cellulolyticus TaxID=35830 RepID=UPI0001E2D15C|nr:GNAT family N-acetyltransferase [Acetivibrio cellulolyticus]